MKRIFDKILFLKSCAKSTIQENGRVRIYRAKKRKPPHMIAVKISTLWDQSHENKSRRLYRRHRRNRRECPHSALGPFDRDHVRNPGLRVLASFPVKLQNWRRSRWVVFRKNWRNTGVRRLGFRGNRALKDARSPLTPKPLTPSPPIVPSTKQ